MLTAVLPPGTIQRLQGAHTGRACEHLQGAGLWNAAIITRLLPLAAILPLPVAVTASLEEQFRWSGNVSPAMQLAGRAPVIARFSIGTCTIVRHPGYSDTVVTSLGLALAPSSWWALIPAALASGAAYATIEL